MTSTTCRRLPSPQFVAQILIDNSQAGERRSVFGLFSVPARLYPWALLLVWQLLVPQASFLGHLTGLLVRGRRHGGAGRELARRLDSPAEVGPCTGWRRCLAAPPQACSRYTHPNLTAPTPRQVGELHVLGALRWALPSAAAYGRAERACPCYQASGFVAHAAGAGGDSLLPTSHPHAGVGYEALSPRSPRLFPFTPFPDSSHRLASLFPSPAAAAAGQQQGGAAAHQQPAAQRLGGGAQPEDARAAAAAAAEARAGGSGGKAGGK